VVATRKLLTRINFSTDFDETGRATLAGSHYYTTISEDIGYYDTTAKSATAGCSAMALVLIVRRSSFQNKIALRNFRWNGKTFHSLRWFNSRRFCRSS
jgi:hypothetical protein